MNWKRSNAAGWQLGRSAKSGAVALVLASIAFGLTAPPADAVGSWSQLDTYNYAWPGVYEKYVFGGTTYYDNNTWDANEGIDCSAYASKSWALPNYRAASSTQRLNPPDYTGAWWNYQVAGTVEMNWADLLDYTHVTMNVMVWHNTSGQHMGLLHSYNGNTGHWTTFEALNPSTGVILNDRTWQDIEITHNGERFSRWDWPH